MSLATLNWQGTPHLRLYDPTSLEVLRLARLGGRARDVVAGLAELPWLVGASDGEIATRLQVQATVVAEVMGHLRCWGWFASIEGSEALRREQLVALSNRLRGVLDVRDSSPPGPAVKAIITLPERSTALRVALARTPDYYETRDGFAHIAARARKRLVFLIPFIDRTGADAVCNMLANTDARERIVITRPDSKGERHYLRNVPQLREAGATILEYWLEQDKAVTGLNAETFHAKLVVADAEVVYVGSSNLIASSLDGGLECGVILEGLAAKPFCIIIDAVVAIARPLGPEHSRS